MIVVLVVTRVGRGPGRTLYTHICYIYIPKHSNHSMYGVISYIYTYITSSCVLYAVPSRPPTTSILGCQSCWKFNCSVGRRKLPHAPRAHPTWRIIPGLWYVVNNHGDNKSPKDWVVPIPNGRTLWLRNGGDPNHWTKSLDDPPSRNIVFQNSVGVDAGRARQNHYGSCVAVFLGKKNIEFRGPNRLPKISFQKTVIRIIFQPSICRVPLRSFREGTVYTNESVDMHSYDTAFGYHMGPSIMYRKVWCRCNWLLKAPLSPSDLLLNHH